MVLGAAGRAADGVYLERQIFNAQESEYLGGKGDYLRVRGGCWSAENLNAELVKFSVSAGLRLLVAVARGYIAGLLRQGLVEKPVLQECARAPAVPSGRRVIERPPLSRKVYISFCTTSVVSPTPRENSSVCSNTGVRISLKPKRAAISSSVFRETVFIARRGQHILRTLDGLCKKSHVFVPSIKH